MINFFNTTPFEKQINNRPILVSKVEHMVSMASSEQRLGMSREWTNEEDF